MTRHLYGLPGVLVVAAAAITLALAPATLWALPLSAAAIRIEINGTDGDAGVQFFVDGTGWKSCAISDPYGNLLVEVHASGSAQLNGLTELFIESAEPSFEEQALDELLALFPAGKYGFECVSTADKTLRRTASLTHALPATPQILGFDPVAGTIGWQAVAGSFEWDGVVFGAGGVVIVAYEVIVERLSDGRRFGITLPAPASAVTVPPEFLRAKTAYKVEVLAIDQGGNQTIGEAEFTTP